MGIDIGKENVPAFDWFTGKLTSYFYLQQFWNAE
jgi:hypothetical protein